ncbi:MAG: alanine/glycine:cation symporter family protein [Thainema sp.]
MLNTFGLLPLELKQWLEQIEIASRSIAERLDQILFFSIGGMPLIILWIVGAAVFFTLRLGFINLRAFGHAIAVLRGQYDDPDDEGEVSHFQALATALSATVGLGNIAGVAIAISLGGPGAVVWMTLGGFLGMSSKFVECTLAQQYRQVRPDGTVAGGPMYYLSEGLAKQGFPRVGKVLAGIFALLAVGGGFGGGNLFQANQSYSVIARVIPTLPDWGYGLGLTLLTALVILGGITRIGRVAAALIPALCAVYAIAALWVLIVNVTAIPAAVATIIHSAFSPTAVEGGAIGVMVQGLRWSVFSNGAGTGSAAIAHAAARTKEPVREGIVAMLEPFIDTVVICNMTALVIITTGTYALPQAANLEGAELTAAAFGSVISWFPSVLAIAVFFFAFSTIMSWGYYGEQAWVYLFCDRSIPIYKMLFLITVFLGATSTAGAAIMIGNSLTLAMAVPNLLGGYWLLSQIMVSLNDYTSRYHKGATQAIRPLAQPKHDAK